MNCLKTTEAGWKKTAFIHLLQEKNIYIKLIFASIKRKDESTLLKHLGCGSIPPCISAGGGSSVTGTTLRKPSDEALS